MEAMRKRRSVMKLFTLLFEQEYSGLSDQELIQLNRTNTLTGVSYLALQNVLSKRGLTTYRIIEIEKNAYQEKNKWLDVKKKSPRWGAKPQFFHN
jgi:hypothetical protein